jgi:hypothetical protein
MKWPAISRLALPMAALVALGYLVTMVVVGARPVQRQLEKFAASGVLRLAPEAIRKITIARAGRRVALIREGEDWRPDAGGFAVSRKAAKHIDTALKMLHRSGPVREIPPGELSGVDTRPFLLDNPAVIAVLSDGGSYAMTVHFGGLNPEGFLQYMQIEGDPQLYLMSRFIGAEWVAAFEEATAE